MLPFYKITDFGDVFFYILKQKLSEISGKVRAAAGTIFYSEPQNKRIVAHMGLAGKVSDFLERLTKLRIKNFGCIFDYFH